MMVRKVEAAGGRDGVQPVVGQAAAEDAARRPARADETVTGIGHAVQLEDGTQTALVERRVVRHERKPLDAGRDLPPHLREIGRIGRILVPQAVDGRRETAVKIGPRTNQAVKRIHDLAAPHNHHAHRADARAAAVGRLEIYGCEIGHFLKKLFARQR